MPRKREHAGQGLLFGAPEPVRRATRRFSRRVGPAAIDEARRDLAGRLPSNVRLGTSSWSFPGWTDLVYDRECSTNHLARHGLAAYARHPLFHAVGIDRTYYAPLTAEELARYAEVVDDDFRFLVKAAGLCTDPWVRQERGRAAGRNETFLDAAFAGDEVVAPYVEGLGPKAGALVFQFPPLGSTYTSNPGEFAASLAGFLSALPTGPTYAVELRDRALLGDDYVRVLAETGTYHCYTAHPRMPPLGEQRRRVGARDKLVGRWMLHPGLGYAAAKDRYAPFSRIVDEDPDTRAAFAALCLEQIPSGGSVIVTANNKAEGSAPETVFRLAGEIVELFRRRGDSTD